MIQSGYNGYVVFTKDFFPPNCDGAKKGDLTYCHISGDVTAECFSHYCDTMRCYPSCSILDPIDLFAIKFSFKETDPYFKQLEQENLFSLESIKDEKPFIIRPKPAGPLYIEFFITRFRIAETVSPKTCICDIPTLMARGCQCGGN